MINNLKTILKVLNIKQKDLAKKIDVDSSTLCDFGNSNSKYIYIKNLELIANAIGLPIESILDIKLKGSWSLEVVNGSCANIVTYDNLTIKELNFLIDISLKCDKKVIVWNNLIKEKIDGKLFLNTAQGLSNI